MKKPLLIIMFLILGVFAIADETKDITLVSTYDTYTYFLTNDLNSVAKWKKGIVDSIKGTLINNEIIEDNQELDEAIKNEMARYKYSCVTYTYNYLGATIQLVVINEKIGNKYKFTGQTYLVGK